MQLARLTDLNLIYKIREIMESSVIGFSSANYRAIDGYPNELDLKTGAKWPTITVEIDSLFGRDVEIGSNKWPALQVSIDVFARTDSQRDDLTYSLWKQLNEQRFTLYDFNSAFPAVLGDYTGIPSLGEYSMSDLSVFNLTPPEDTIIEGLKHHSLIDGIIYLPNI